MTRNLILAGLCGGMLAAASWPTPGEAADLLPRSTKKKDAAAAPAKPAQQEIDFTKAVATVNGENITRAQLAEELIETFGQKQLELIIHRKLIEQACRDRKIEITRAEIEKEFEAQLEKMKMTRKDFVNNVLAQRDLTYMQYLRDTIWPKIALTKLVKDKVTVTDDDLKKAFEANYGEKVDCRMLVVRELRRSQELWEQANAEKDTEKRLKLFEDLCKTYSVDEATRQFGGKCQPINHHTSFPDVEKLAFGLQPGELSKIIQVNEGNLMLLCVARIPARTDVTMDTKIVETSKETVRDMLRKDIFEKKLRYEVLTYFTSLREKGLKGTQNFLTADFDPESLRSDPAPGKPEKENSVKPRTN